jgi:hypothetical protein
MTYCIIVTKFFTFITSASAIAPLLPMLLLDRLQYSTAVIKDNAPRKAIA